ncbi:hypothetical protein Tco_1346713 [Tanacetum coccineum]
MDFGCLIKATKVKEMEKFQEFPGSDESNLAEEKPRMNTRKRDMAYQRQVFTRKRVFTIPNMAYPPSAIRHIHEDNYS